VAGSEADGQLASLPGADQRLELLEADLLDPGAFDTAVVGCEYVMHTASPFVLDVENPQHDLIDPAVKGLDPYWSLSQRPEGCDAWS
jgi:hypothetical protein